MRNVFKACAITLAALLFIGTPAVAFNDSQASALAVVQPSPDTVGPVELKPGAVWGSNIQPNTIPWAALGSQMRGEIRAAQGPIIGNQRIAPGTVFMDQLAHSAKQQIMDIAQLTEPKTVVNVGGPINTQGTKLGLGLKLKHGSYLVTVSGQINRTTTAATPGKQTQPQLSLWLDRNRDGEFTWQTEGSISPNGTIPDLAGRSVTVSGTTVLTINQSTPMDIDLVAHGYNNDQSGAGSGELTVINAVISAIPIAP